MPHVRVHAELLVDLPAQTGVKRFTWLAFAAGKLPQAFEMRALQSTREEVRVTTSNDGGSNDDGGRMH
jgi:hypothetical protein